MSDAHIPNAKLQSDFDFVMDAIIGQGGPAIDGDACRYIMDNGRRCAIGHMLTPDEARAMRGMVLGAALDCGAVPARFHEYFDFYAELQHAHDTAAHVSNSDAAFFPLFTRKMSIVANNWGLEMKEAA